MTSRHDVTPTSARVRRLTNLQYSLLGEDRPVYEDSLLDDKLYSNMSEKARNSLHRINLHNEFPQGEMRVSKIIINSYRIQDTLQYII